MPVTKLEASLEEARMTYFWTWFNVLTMGLVDAAMEDAGDQDEEEIEPYQPSETSVEKTDAEASDSEMDEVGAASSISSSPARQYSTEHDGRIVASHVVHAVVS